MSCALEVTRRQFLQGAGALVIHIGTSRTFAAELPRSLAANPEIDRWLRVDLDGTVSVFSGKCELGQGIKTALAQIVADELDVSIARIRMQTVDTARSPNEGGTVGSNSVQDSGAALRMAAAEARQILLENASRRLAAPLAELRVDDGRITAVSSGQSIEYWTLLSAEGFNTGAGGEVAAKNPNQYRYVGQSQARVDLPAKMFGEAAFVHDIAMPDMLHARVVRAGGIDHALNAVDDSVAASMPGVVSVLRDGSFLAVVAEREEQAVAAAEALRASASWAPAPYPDNDDFPDRLRSLPSEDSVIKETADSAGAGVRQLQAAYSRPFLAHASLGPSAALAVWDGSLLTVWSHSQGMYPLRDAIATVAGLPREQIRCIHADGAGCYGHNGADDVACDAALIALAHVGKPVRLLWSRQDEFRCEPYGSAMSMQVAAALDASDRIVDWSFDVWSCSHQTRPGGGEPAGGMLAARQRSNRLPMPRVNDVGQPAGGADRNAVPIYSIPQQRIVEHLILEPPLRCSALRSLGAHANVFAIESFIDELADSINADPYDFRLRHLEDPRGRAVIEAVREWAERAPLPRTDANVSRDRLGRGLGFARYKNLSTYLAVVADVSVNPNSGAIRLHRVCAAVDAGQVVNPDGLRNQIEGGIVQTASWTLKEQVRFSRDGIASVDWASYPILRFDEVPEIEVLLLDRPELPFVGAGEAAQGPTAAAIANAFADATGIRLRDLPLAPERVLAALR